MCLLIFLFDLRSKTKKSLVEKPDLKNETSERTDEIPRLPVSESRALAKEHPAEPVTRTVPADPVAKSEQTTKATTKRADDKVDKVARSFLGAEEAAREEGTMRPRPGSPLRPRLGHRWTSSHLREFEHPFMPRPADQRSLASTEADLAANEDRVRDAGDVQLGAAEVSHAGTPDIAKAKNQDTNAGTDPCSSVLEPVLDVAEVNIMASSQGRNRRLREDNVSISTIPSMRETITIAPSTKSVISQETYPPGDCTFPDDRSASSFEIISSEDLEEDFEVITKEDAIGVL